MSPEERFWERVDRSGGPDACWAYAGARSADGYGRVRLGGRVIGSHVAAYEFARGPIERGLVVRHLCVERSSRRIPGGPLAERACCNPRHLELGTQRENAGDRSRAGRSGRRADGRPAGRRYW